MFSSFFDKLERHRCFESRRKLLLQGVYTTLVLVAIIITGVKLNSMTGPRTRSDTLAIVMGVKSLVFMAYQVITTHVDRFRKWASLRAYKIIDCMEIVFWFVVVIISFMGVSARCDGTACALAVIVALIAMVLMCFAAWLAGIAILDHRYYKQYGVKRGDSAVAK